MKLPISVVVPHMPSRAKFFKEVCLPSIHRNRPAQIITKTFESLLAQRKRNLGASDATEPYLIFVDDDVELEDHCLVTMYEKLSKARPAIAFAYSDYKIKCHGNWQHPAGELYKSEPFSAMRLREGNYISMVSLMRRAVFPGMDENLRRLQDWELWLRVVNAGYSGLYIDEPLFTAHYLGESITERESMELADMYVRKRHGL